MTDNSTKDASLRLVHSQALAAPPDAKRYVRITERMGNGMIGFDFAIGTPDLFVELVLPEAAFEMFCKTNNAVFMTEEESAMVDEEMEKFRYGDEGLERRRAAADLRAARDS